MVLPPCLVACLLRSLRTNEAKKRHAARDETYKWFVRCKEQEHRTLKWKARVLKETQFFNGRVITGQYQR